MGWIWRPSLQGGYCCSWVSVFSFVLLPPHHQCTPTPEPLWSCCDPPPQQWGHQVSWWRRMRHLMYKNYILFNIHCPTITIILPYSNCIACRLLLWKCSSRRVTTPHRWNWHNSVQLTVLHQFKDAQSACRKSVFQTQMKNNLKLKSGILFTSIHWVLTEAKQASLTTLR